MDAETRWKILRLHVEDHVPLAAIARDFGIGLRTLERWHARYRDGGYAALHDKPRGDAGTHRLPADLIRLIEGLALMQPRPQIATLHRRLTGICAARGWPPPSYAVVRSIIQDLDPGMVTLARNPH